MATQGLGSADSLMKDNYNLPRMRRRRRRVGQQLLKITGNTELLGKRRALNISASDRPTGAASPIIRQTNLGQQRNIPLAGTTQAPTRTAFRPARRPTEYMGMKPPLRRRRQMVIRQGFRP